MCVCVCVCVFKVYSTSAFLYFQICTKYFSVFFTPKIGISERCYFKSWS